MFSNFSIPRDKEIRNCLIKGLTLSQSSTLFYVSAVQILWKLREKEKLLVMSAISPFPSVFLHSRWTFRHFHQIKKSHLQNCLSLEGSKMCRLGNIKKINIIRLGLLLNQRRLQKFTQFFRVNAVENTAIVLNFIIFSQPSELRFSIRFYTSKTFQGLKRLPFISFTY